MRHIFSCILSQIYALQLINLYYFCVIAGSNHREENPFFCLGETFEFESEINADLHTLLSLSSDYFSRLGTRTRNFWVTYNPNLKHNNLIKLVW